MLQEAKIFHGPLPKHVQQHSWARAGGRHYFADTLNQSCSWIDPRSAFLRPDLTCRDRVKSEDTPTYENKLENGAGVTTAAVGECIIESVLEGVTPIDVTAQDLLGVPENHLPYGWSEIVEPSKGIRYYADHLDRVNTRFGPWANQTVDLIKRVRQSAIEARQQQRNQCLDSKRKKDAVIGEFLSNYSQLADEALVLKKLKRDGLKHEQHTLQQKMAAQAAEMDANNRDAYFLDNEARESEKCGQQLEQLIALLEMHDTNLMNAAQAMNTELSEIRNMIEIEAAQRAALDGYVQQLRVEVEAEGSKMLERLVK
ncbi:hypothetical protein DFS34DRAFT_653079 [Phlyctochytrium arcticum]|nr:hypothetical protein DFS34DRAFT_653079 [Phlyctochytrium arcticum]